MSYEQLLPDAVEIIANGSKEAYCWLDSKLRAKLKKFPTDARLFVLAAYCALKSGRPEHSLNTAKQGLVNCNEPVQRFVLLQLIIAASQRLNLQHDAFIQEVKKLTVLPEKVIGLFPFYDATEFCQESKEQLAKLLNQSIDAILNCNKNKTDYFTEKVIEIAPASKAAAALMALKDSCFREASTLFEELGGHRELAVSGFCNYLAGDGKSAAEKVLKSASATDDPLIKRFCADICYMTGHVSEAHKSLEALKENEQTKEILLNIGTCLMREGKFSEALNEVSGLKSRQATYIRAFAHANLGKHRQAIKEAAKLLVESPEPLLDLAELFVKNSDHNNAIACYNAVLEVFDIPDTKLSKAKLLLPDRAAEAIQIARSVARTATDIGLLIGALEVLSSAGADMRSVTKKLLSIDAHCQPALQAHVVMLFKEGKIKEGLHFAQKLDACLIRTAALSNGEGVASGPETGIILGVLAEANGKLDEAIRYYEAASQHKLAIRVRAIKKSKLAESKALEEGLRLEREGKYQEAIASYNRCSAIESHLGIVRCLHALGRKNEVITMARECCSSNNSEILVETGKILEQLGEPVASVAERILTLDQRNEWALTIKLLQLVKGNLMKEAADLAEKIPDNKDITPLKLEAFLKSERFSKAVKLCETYSITDERYFIALVESGNIERALQQKELNTEKLQGRPKLIAIGMQHESQGEFDAALQEYMAAGAHTTISNLASKLAALEDIRALDFWQKYLEMHQDRHILEQARAFLAANDHKLQICQKARLSFAQGKKLVICDTNVLLFSYVLKHTDPCSRKHLMASFKLESLLRNCIVRLPYVTYTEFCHCARQLVQTCDASKQSAVMQELKQLHQLVLHPQSINEQLAQTIDFYKKRSERVTKISAVKTEGLSEHEKQKKLALRNGGSLPEEGDLKLLAHCIVLSQSRMPGIRKIALLSDDRDFLEFATDIKEVFEIQVMPLGLSPE